MKHQSGKVEVWRETITIPTYGVGAPDKNPMFLEKRVYQGSSGKVYPYPVIDKILDEKRDCPYQAVFLENDYLYVMILPELGGRIQRAYDKTNGYDFVYYNHVIKPALVGLTGPWISGGIEFNWPQHHRPTTFAPTDCVLESNPDGSCTVRVSEVDQMYGTKGMACFTLYPDKAYIEIKGQLYNRTNLPQTFLWWANPAIAVNDHTQSIFPPDVHAVMDHGKRDVSRFPIATGTYYKHDYGAGVDISRYKNIPVPTSYMAYHSDYNFVGGYDYEKQAGILHIADHHVSPGKKQWTWGCGDFGQAWDRNLTDEDGPYIELMTGMFTDNQPDFTWLAPFEEKTFTQYFMPYKKVGYVQNTNTEAVLGLTVEQNTAQICVYTTACYENAHVTLSNKESILFERTLTLSPTQILEASVPTTLPAHALTLTVTDACGRVLLSCTPRERTVEPIPAPAQPALPPAEIATCEELYLTGQHLEQYRHATYLPEDYYLEGLHRDRGDIRLNTAYGLLLLRRAHFAEAENHFRSAVQRSIWKNPNPWNSEPYFCLGLALLYQGKEDEAFDAFYKSVWSAAQQEIGFYYLAAICCRRGQWGEALEHLERSLVKNAHNLKARGLRAQILFVMGRHEEARAQLAENQKIDPFDYRSRLLSEKYAGLPHTETLALMGNRASSFIECAIDFAETGFYAEAIETLRLCDTQSPMLKYYEALYLDKTGQESAVDRVLSEAAACSPLYCFPNRLEDVEALTFALGHNSSDARASYYLGCLFYDKRNYHEAQRLWELSAQLDSSFPTVWRNLALVYYNRCSDAQQARTSLERAFALDTSDARVLLELDQLYKKLGISPQERITHLYKYRVTAFQRDDLYTEYISLLNLLGRFEEAYEMLVQRHFHPWEGGEGKVTKQYVRALSGMARHSLAIGDAPKALSFLEQALIFPQNLGEGKLEGQKDNDVYYLLGLCHKHLHQKDAAQKAFELAAEGDSTPAGAMYYNDQPADMILYRGLAKLALGHQNEATKCFHQLIDYGEAHLFDEVQIDYFAVSLPELQLFEENLTARNKLHCHYLIGLGSMGLGDCSRAKDEFVQVLKSDPAHPGVSWLLHPESRVLECR